MLDLFMLLLLFLIEQLWNAAVTLASVYVVTDYMHVSPLCVANVCYTEPYNTCLNKHIAFGTHI
jgi:hypothetical protein